MLKPTVVLVAALTSVLAAAGSLSAQAPAAKPPAAKPPAAKPAAAKPATQPGADPVKRGKYLVVFGGCSDCHTPKLLTPNGLALDSSRLLSGHPSDVAVNPPQLGMLSPDGWMAATNMHLTAWVGPWGVTFAANLTPDATGLGSWSDSTFIATMRSGKHMGVGRDILPPMPWQSLGALTDDDLKAIFAFLKSVKPVQNVVPSAMTPSLH
ncbi:MAG TPA: hypothetical protein VLV16_10115 [Gemmatimonadales bacterium]|nr:hypothetical protein [Gemmatimonadales bacterium]